MATYKIRTDNGLKFIDLDENLKKGDKGFLVDGNIAKINGDVVLFEVVNKNNKIEKSDIDKAYEIEELQKEDEKRFVLGRVLIPDRVDADKDIMNAREIEKAAHRFMINEHTAAILHKSYAEGMHIVESYIAPTDFEINGEKIIKGTWLMGLRVFNDEVWGAIKDGKLNAYSIGGWSKRIPIKQYD